MRKSCILLLVTLLVVACQDKPVYDSTVYITGAQQDNPSLNLTIDDQFPKEMGVTVSSSVLVDKDTKVTLKADPSRVEEYNNKYGKNSVALPEGTYELINNELTIREGFYVSESPMKLSIKNKNGMKEGASYILPLSIASVDGSIKSLDGFTTVYVVIGQVIVGAAVNLPSSSTYFKVDFSKGVQQKYDVANLKQVTYEARINVNSFTKSRWCNTVMGLEENFMLRFVQDNFIGQLQVSGIGTLMVPSGGMAVATKTWTHVAAVFDGINGRASIFINGKQEASMAITKASINMMEVYQDDMFRIGTSCSDGRQLDGRMSEVRVWAKALTGNELQNNMCYVDPTSEGLLAYWRMNDNTPIKEITDMTGHGFSARYMGSAINWVQGVRCPE